MLHSLSKDTAFTGETAPRHTFLCGDSQCLPPGDPRILCAKQGYPITGKSFIELSRVCVMRSFWKLVLRFKCCSSKSTQMVSSLLYFNLWRCLVPACTNATAKTKRVTFWHAPCSEALEFSFISSGSERKWFIHLYVLTQGTGLWKVLAWSFSRLSFTIFFFHFVFCG